MTFTVGGVDVTAVHVGATAADAVYLGDVKVWPTAPAIYTWDTGPDTHRPGNRSGLVAGVAFSYSQEHPEMNQYDRDGKNMLDHVAVGVTVEIVVDGGAPITRVLTGLTMVHNFGSSKAYALIYTPLGIDPTVDHGTLQLRVL